MIEIPDYISQKPLSYEINDKGLWIDFQKNRKFIKHSRKTSELIDMYGGVVKTFTIPETISYFYDNNQVVITVSMRIGLMHLNNPVVEISTEYVYESGWTELKSKIESVN